MMKKSLIAIIFFITILPLFSQSTDPELWQKGFTYYNEKNYIQAQKYLFAFLNNKYKELKPSQIDSIEDMIEYCEEKIGTPLVISGTDTILASVAGVLNEQASSKSKTGFIVTSNGTLLTYDDFGEQGVVIDLSKSKIPTEQTDLYQGNWGKLMLGAISSVEAIDTVTQLKSDTKIYNDEKLLEILSQKGDTVESFQEISQKIIEENDLMKLQIEGGSE